MAGTGRAPKDPSQRRRYNQPLRGEWVDLVALKKPVLPRFNPRTMSAPAWLWNAWRRDPVGGQYADADIAAITLLAVEWADLKASEQRLRMDSLGLTPKGKRDLRWRTPNEVKTIEAQGQRATVTTLRAVGTGP